MNDSRKRAPIVGSATAITSSSPQLKKMLTTESWQSDAWEFYDSVGELRFGASWVAKALSKVRLIAATPPSDSGDEPVEITTPGIPQQLVKGLAGGIQGQSQMNAEFGKLLTVSGASYLLGMPRLDQPWSVRSTEEIRSQGNQVQVSIKGSWLDVTDQDLLVKVWLSHPRNGDVPDAPVRSVLPVLRQIRLIDQRIEADAISRLAGAGILTIPLEATFPQSAGATGDQFDEALMNHFVVPISDRSSASAVVPFVVRVPADMASAVRHITTATPFDDRLENLRESAIRRLALGLDMPPETLMGVGSSNHWSAWAIEEEAIALHVEPLMEVICHGLNIGYMEPALTAAGQDPKSAMIWYDSTALRNKPDRSDVAITLNASGDLSDAALLRETGFDESDAPLPAERMRNLLEKIVVAHPELLPTLAMQLEMPSLQGVNVNPGKTVQDEESVPDTETKAPPSESDSDRVGLLAASDLMVSRALEKAGARLRTKLRNGGATAPDVPNHELHTRIPDVSAHLELESLLADAWIGAEHTALILGTDGSNLRQSLDTYTRSLLANGMSHDVGRLAVALGC